MMILSLLLLSTADMGKSYKSFQCWVQYRPRDCVISAQLPDCEKFHWATVARSDKHCLLGSFLFVIASPGIRHPGFPIIDSQSQNYKYSGVWCVVHMAAPCDRRGPIRNQLTSGWVWEPITCTVYEWWINWRNLLPAVHVGMFCCVNMIVRRCVAAWKAGRPVCFESRQSY